MRKAIFLLVLFLILSVKSVFAAENICPSYPVISNCNLNYIMETNVSSLANLVSNANGGFASLIGLTLQNPPVSGKDFVAYERAKFHVPGTPSPVYAAIGGLGYNSLGPVLQIWVVMRNLAYFVFAIIFVVIGVMILIRSKIDPKTTMTIQNALPKIILALVLVTFSYAIAGFLIDIMYVALALVLTIAGSINITLNSTVGGNSPVDLGKNILEHNLFWGFFDGNMWGSIGNASQAVMTAITTFITGQTTGLGGPIGDILRGLGGGIVMLIIAIAILWALFKTWLMLLSAYANVILGIIFSPIQLMMDAIPGQNQFSGWLRNMLSNLLAFPAVLAMILIGLILANTNESNPGGVLGFSPPLIGASNSQAITALIGIAIILTIPKTVEMLQEVLKAPKQKFGSAWGEAVGAGVQMGQAARKFGEDQSGITASKAQYQKARGEEMVMDSTGKAVKTSLGWKGFFIKH